jgi:hypothetical protein
LIEVVDHDGRACLREPGRNGPANAAAGTGHQSRFAF